MADYKSVLESNSSEWTALANIFRVFLFLAPYPTLRTIMEEKHTGPHSAAFYVLSFLSCILWVFYGIRFDPNNKTLITYINAVGTVLNLIYVIIHYLHAPVKERLNVALLKLATIIVLVVILATAIYVVPTAQKKTAVGWICGVLNILTYAAPLSVVNRVIETENVAGLPFLISFLTLLNSAIWLLYSVFHKEARSTLVPNAIGSVFALAQVLLHYLYADKGSKNDAKENEPEARMEHFTS